MEVLASTIVRRIGFEIETYKDDHQIQAHIAKVRNITIKRSHFITRAGPIANFSILLI